MTRKVPVPALPVQYTLQTRVDDLTAPWVKAKFMVMATMLRRHGYTTVVFSDDFFNGHQDIVRGDIKLEGTEFMGETG